MVLYLKFIGSVLIKKRREEVGIRECGELIGRMSGF